MNAQRRREIIGRYYLNLVNRRISGQLTQEQFDRMNLERPLPEQLTLGIGAVTKQQVNAEEKR